jgi:autophagy-related protein 9
VRQVVAHTHHMPRHWRGRAHTREVQGAFNALFQFKAGLLGEEMLSILATPFVLYFSLPRCAGAPGDICCVRIGKTP